ncbi:hypothetical protein [Caulobacter sp.]|uniref:hypothetical protein n=1 Tax=Caulobacter sp. TaxID=78 RepID=UPI003BAF9234
MRTVALVVSALILGAVATPSLAASYVKVEVIDASTLRVSAPPKAGVKFDKMRANLLRAASEETLRRGYAWFDLGEVADLTRERDVTIMKASFPASANALSPDGKVMLATGNTVVDENGGSVHLIEPGAAATIHMGNGLRPDSATTVDAQQMLQSLR